MHNTELNKDKTMLPKGAVLQGGRYRIEEYLASGGFGNTYLAINNFDEKVAIKEFFMKDINQRDEDSTRISVSNPNSKPIFEEQKSKFLKEAKRLRGFRSKHIVGVIDLFDENDTMYYVMDYIDGESLRDIIGKRGRLPEEEVRGYLMQILDALEEVHDQRMLHLDLKPANIMIDKNGCVHLIDFGASKQQKADGNGATTSSALVHTPGYAPVEQKDQQLDKFGPWTDLYALGATLYNALTGKTPPSTTNILDEGPAVFQFPEAVSKEMHQLIIWMMNFSRNERPQTVSEVRKKLDRTVDDDEETIFVDPPFVQNDELEKEDQDEPTSLAGTVIPQNWRWYYWLFFPVLLICDTPKNKLSNLLLTYLIHPFLWIMIILKLLPYENHYDSSMTTTQILVLIIWVVNLIGGVALIYPAGKKACQRLEMSTTRLIVLAGCHLLTLGGVFFCTAAYLLFVPLYYKFFVQKTDGWDKQAIVSICNRQAKILSMLLPLLFCIGFAFFTLMLMVFIFDS